MGFSEKAKIGLVFIIDPHQRLHGLIKGDDYERERNEITGFFRNSFPENEFIVRIAYSKDKGERVVKKLKEEHKVDGFVYYLLGIWTGVAYVVAKSGLPIMVTQEKKQFHGYIF
jgi:hypothetical protein